MAPERGFVLKSRVFYPVMSFLLAALAGCAEVQVRTLPPPPPTAKLRVVVQAVSSPGTWKMPDAEFARKVLLNAEKVLHETGIYEMTNISDEKFIFAGGRPFSRWEWAKEDWKLARRVGRAVHADYVIVVARSMHRGYIFWEMVFLNVETGKKYRSVSRISMRPDWDVDDYVKVFRVNYGEIFREAKGDFLATAIRKSQGAPLAIPAPLSPEPAEAAKEAKAPPPALEAEKARGPQPERIPPAPVPPSPAPSSPRTAAPPAKERPLAPSPSPSSPARPSAEPSSSPAARVPAAKTPLEPMPGETKSPSPPSPAPAPAASAASPPTPTSAARMPEREKPPLPPPAAVSAAPAKTPPPEKASGPAPKPTAEVPEELAEAKVLDVEKILAAEVKPDGRRRLAVYDLEAAEALKVVSLILSEALREELVRLGLFALVNRENLVQVLKEIELQMTGLVDEKQAVRVGKGLAASQVVMGRFGGLGKTSILQAKRVDVENQGTLSLGSLKCAQGQEDELLNQMPDLARKLAGLP